MSKHKSEDYKIIAVKYYLENDTNYTKTCDIFKCSERSLKRWIERYEELEEISVVTKDGKHIILIKDGRFVLPGTEILNEPLKQLEN